MSAKGKDPADKPAAESADPDRPTIAPFVGAFVIVVLVLIGILVIDGLGGDELTPEQTISRAVVGQNDALQRQDYAAFRDFTCAAASGDEDGVIAAQKESVEKQGERYVEDVDNVRIAGTQATASVTYSFDKARDDKTTSDVTLVEEGGTWRVCTPVTE